MGNFPLGRKNLPTRVRLSDCRVPQSFEKSARSLRHRHCVWLIRALTRSKSARQVMFPSKSISTLVCAGAICFALAPGAGAQTTTTFLAIGSDPEDPVGNGTDVYLDSQTATFTSFQSSGPGRHFWSATIQPTNNSPTPGDNLHAAQRRRPHPGQTARGGMPCGSHPPA